MSPMGITLSPIWVSEKRPGEPDHLPFIQQSHAGWRLRVTCAHVLAFAENLNPGNAEKPVERIRLPTNCIKGTTAQCL